MQVEGQRGSGLPFPPATGARVSNTYPTCHELGYSPLKGGLTPDVAAQPHGSAPKVSRFMMGMRLISLPAG